MVAASICDHWGKDRHLTSNCYSRDDDNHFVLFRLSIVCCCVLIPVCNAPNAEAFSRILQAAVHDAIAKRYIICDSYDSALSVCIRVCVCVHSALRVVGGSPATPARKEI